MYSAIDQNVSFSEMCRICRRKGKDLVSIFHMKRNAKTLADMLCFCLQLNIHQRDGKPANICLACIPKLMSTFEFLNKAKSSEQYFQEIILSANSNRKISSVVDETTETLVTTVFDANIEDPLESGRNISQYSDVIGTNFKEELVVDEEHIRDSDEITATFIHQPLKKIPLLNTGTTSVKTSLTPIVSRKKIEFYECYICKRHPFTIKKLRVHLKTHDNMKAFKCAVCGESYRIKFDADRHLCHGKRITCEYCSISCSSIKEIIEHLNIHKDQWLYYKCLRCVKSFNMKELYTWHDTEHDRYQFECLVCGKRFATKSSVKNHRMVHREERPHLCAECGKGFKDKSSLKKHVLTHSNERPFACSECPSKFRRQGALTSHMSVHRVEKHVCHQCGTIVKSQVSLRQHKKWHEKREKECEVCSLKFHTADRLKVHMRTHTGEKPFSCPYCNVSYAQNNDLNKHLRTHLGENTYICNNCETAFRYHSDWRKHMQTCTLTENPTSVANGETPASTSNTI